MSYRLHEMSDRAKRMFVPDAVSLLPLPHSLKRDFPFSQMKKGQSFYLRFDETTEALRTRARTRLRHYNKTYISYFVAILHKDYPMRLEIARIA